MNVVDRFGLYNVKPVGPDGEPTGNDGLIVSAYAMKAGLAVDIYKIRTTMMANLRTRRGIPVERLPGKETPYPSRDVLLGAKALGWEMRLEDKDWNYSPLEIPKFSLGRLIIQALSCIGEDRNFFWEYDMDQIYRFAFSVPIQDRSFHLGIRKNPFYSLVAWVDQNFIPARNNSSKLIRWLKYDEIPPMKVFIEYFGAEHPITLKMLFP